MQGTVQVSQSALGVESRPRLGLLCNVTHQPLQLAPSRVLLNDLRVFLDAARRPQGLRVDQVQEVFDATDGIKIPGVLQPLGDQHRIESIALEVETLHLLVDQSVLSSREVQWSEILRHQVDVLRPEENGRDDALLGLNRAVWIALGHGVSGSSA